MMKVLRIVLFDDCIDLKVVLDRMFEKTTDEFTTPNVDQIGIETPKTFVNKNQFDLQSQNLNLLY